MPEQPFLLMTQHGEPRPGAGTFYLAVVVNGETVLPRDLAERAATDLGGPARRFLVPWEEDRGPQQFADAHLTVPMVLLPTDSLWRRGLPTRFDLGAVLAEAFDGADPETALLPIERVIEVATERIGPGEPEDVQPHFDEAVMELRGRIDGGAYAVDVRSVLGG